MQAEPRPFQFLWRAFRPDADRFDLSGHIRANDLHFRIDQANVNIPRAERVHRRQQDGIRKRKISRPAR